MRINMKNIFKFSLALAAVVALLFGLMWRLLGRSFLSLATATGQSEKKRYVAGRERQRSADSALLRKEFGRLTSSANYMLNCALGTLLLPILGVVRAKDFDDAVEKAVWLEHGNRHSAHIHSKNIDHITKYAKEIDTAILVKNGPSYAALGFGGEGYCTFTIASRTGEGLTAAHTFTKSRRCVMVENLCIR